MRISTKTHLFIPDTQVEPGVNTDHIAALGNYIVAHQPDVIVCIGDWWDMPSLCSYEKPGSKYFEGKTYASDVQAGVDAMDRLFSPIDSYNNTQSKWHKRRYKPRLVFTLGNHGARLSRAVHNDPRLAGAISLDHFELDRFGWEVYPFLEIVTVDGIAYSHYFKNPDSLIGTPVGGTIENKMRLIGTSFSMGHQQKRQYGNRYNGLGKEIHGLVCGSFYSHNPDYLGPQGNNYWRGIVVKNEVHDGRYDPCFVSLEYLVDKWT